MEMRGALVANNSTSLPIGQQHYGGFTVGQSRNTNSTPYDSNYAPDYAGWRVWDIDGDTVTLISAGHPEMFNHFGINSLYILLNRDCTMYVNSYATEASLMTQVRLNSWYNKYIDSNVTSCSVGTMFPTKEEVPLITVLENGSYWWNGGAIGSQGQGYLNAIEPVDRSVITERMTNKAYRTSCFN